LEAQKQANAHPIIVKWYSILKKKHEVVERELLASNYYPKLLTELKNLFIKPHHFKAITIPATSLNILETE
jgi:hypothetical protein